MTVHRSTGRTIATSCLRRSRASVREWRNSARDIQIGDCFGLFFCFRFYICIWCTFVWVYPSHLISRTQVTWSPEKAIAKSLNWCYSSSKNHEIPLKTSNANDSVSFGGSNIFTLTISPLKPMLLPHSFNGCLPDVEEFNWLNAL